MKKRKRVLSLLLAGIMVMSLAVGCGSSSSTNSGSTATGSDTSKDKLKVALVLPGKKDDVSFNQAMYRGMNEYYENHQDKIDLKVVEGIYDVSDIESTLLDYANENYDVIIGHGYQFTNPIDSVAKQYPNIAFLCGTGDKETTNSALYDVQLEAGGYLMGVIAALATQSNKIGVVGGGEGGEISRGHEGFKAGAKSINPDIEIQEVFTGDWNDISGAKEAAIGMYDSGVDVIWHSGDGIGLGVVQAAKEKDKYVLGNVEDQKSLAPNNVLCGLQYNWNSVLEEMFDTIYDGTFFQDNKPTYKITVANGGLSMTDLNDVKGWLTEDDKAQIEDVSTKLANDKITLPTVDTDTTN